MNKGHICYIIILLELPRKNFAVYLGLKKIWLEIILHLSNNPESYALNFSTDALIFLNKCGYCLKYTLLFG
jgi:hypothetical protein